jgi:hypothetical protein
MGWTEKQVPPLRYPGFPVDIGGLGELHAAFLNESRTRGRWGVLRSRKSGFAPVGMTNLFEIDDLARYRSIAKELLSQPKRRNKTPATKLKVEQQPLSTGPHFRSGAIVPSALKVGCALRSNPIAPEAYEWRLSPLIPVSIPKPRRSSRGNTAC